MQNTQIRNIRRQRQSGFTLIELLIVVAIIGILAAVGVPQYNSYLDRASASACQAELSAFRSGYRAADTVNNADGFSYTFQSCYTDDESTTLAAKDDVTSIIDGTETDEGNDNDPVTSKKFYSERGATVTLNSDGSIETDLDA